VRALERLVNFLWGLGSGFVIWALIFLFKGAAVVARAVGQLGFFILAGAFMLDLYRNNWGNARCGGRNNSGNSSSRYMSDSGNGRNTEQV